MSSSSSSSVEVSPTDQAASPLDTSVLVPLHAPKPVRPPNDIRRPSAIAFAEPSDPRRPSVAFKSNGPQSATLPPSSSNLNGRVGRQRSLSSPPPPPTFIKRVGFDTFANKDASDFSLTLKSKHKDYKYGRQSRTFLVGTDDNEYSTTALEYLIEELVDDNDEIVCLRVIDKDSKYTTTVVDSGHQEQLYRMEADKLLQNIIKRNDEDIALSIILEFTVGKVHDTFQKMIRLYEPIMLVVGTKGRSLGGFQGLLPGSVSKYCLQHSPVPVIVVRPNEKRKRNKRKRQENPVRRTYLDIMARSQALSTLEVMHSNPRSNKVSVDTTPSSTPAPRESITSISDTSDPTARKGSNDSNVDATSPITEGVAELKLSITEPALSAITEGGSSAPE